MKSHDTFVNNSYNKKYTEQSPDYINEESEGREEGVEEGDDEVIEGNGKEGSREGHEEE